jgi:uncharacterized membrane protein
VGVALGHEERNVSPGVGPSTSAARAVRIVVVVLLGLSAVAALVLSLVPYETLKSHVDAFSVDRDADVSRAEFADIVARLRILAGGLVVLAGGLVAFGGAVDGASTLTLSGWWDATRRSPGRLRHWMTLEHPLHLAAFGITLVTGLVIRIAFLDVPLRYDEAATYDNYVSKPLYVALANYSTPNNHLLHTFLAKVSVTLFGNGTSALRLPALLAGLALIPATYAVGRALYLRSTALLAAALVASSSSLIEYSTNARGYTLVALMTLVAVLAGIRVLEHEESIGAWALIAVSGALGLYAVPIALYPVGGIFLWLLVSRLADRASLRVFVRRWLACGVATVAFTLLLYAPVFAASGIRSVTSNEFVEPRTFGDFVDRLPGHFADTLRTWDRDLPWIVTAILAAGLVASLALTPIVSRFRIPPVLAIVVWTIPVLAVQRVVPFTRVWLFLLPLALAASAGFYGWLLEKAPRAPALSAAVAIVAAVGGAALVWSSDSVRESRETGGLLDAPAVAAELAARVRPDDRILATGSDTILEYYLERKGLDASPLLYTDESRRRTFVVVNVLGGQTLEELLHELGGRGQLESPKLLRRYPSALVYLVERRAG